MVAEVVRGGGGGHMGNLCTILSNLLKLLQKKRVGKNPKAYLHLRNQKPGAGSALALAPGGDTVPQASPGLTVHIPHKREYGGPILSDDTLSDSCSFKADADADTDADRLWEPRAILSFFVSNHFPVTHLGRGTVTAFLTQIRGAGPRGRGPEVSGHCLRVTVSGSSLPSRHRLSPARSAALTGQAPTLPQSPVLPPQPPRSARARLSAHPSAMPSHSQPESPAPGPPWPPCPPLRVRPLSCPDQALSLPRPPAHQTGPLPPLSRTISSHTHSLPCPPPPDVPSGSCLPCGFRGRGVSTLPMGPSCRPHLPSPASSPARCPEPVLCRHLGASSKHGPQPLILQRPHHTAPDLLHSTPPSPRPACRLEASPSHRPPLRGACSSLPSVQPGNSRSQPLPGPTCWTPLNPFPSPIGTSHPNPSTRSSLGPRAAPSPS